MEDRGLLEAYRSGQSDALETVYRHYVGAVERLVRFGFSFSSMGRPFRFMGYSSEFERQEMVQETFIRVFGVKARQGYSGLKPFGPYVSGIARNLVVDEFRRRRREMSLFVSEEGDLQSLDVVDRALLAQSPVGQWSRKLESPEEVIAKSELSALMVDFITSLDEKSETLVSAHFIGGCSQSEVGELLGLDRNGVRKEIRKLRLKLLMFMKSRGEIGSLDATELMKALT